MPHLKFEQIEELPEASYRLADSTAYIRLGCAGCKNSVCFSANSEPHPYTALEHMELKEVTGLFFPNTVVRSGFTTEYTRSCVKPCERTQEIDSAVELINEQYGSELQRRDA